MYQIKFECGYEIQVTKSDGSRVVNSQNHIVFEGSFAQCRKYLSDRGVTKEIG